MDLLSQRLIIAVPITVIVLTISSMLAHAGKNRTTSPFATIPTVEMETNPAFLYKITRLLGYVRGGFWNFWKSDRNQAPQPGNRTMPVFDIVRGPLWGEGRYGTPRYDVRFPD
jgi:hypothetical protein